MKKKIVIRYLAYFALRIVTLFLFPNVETIAFWTIVIAVDIIGIASNSPLVKESSEDV